MASYHNRYNIFAKTRLLMYRLKKKKKIKNVSLVGSLFIYRMFIIVIVFVMIKLQ